MKNPIVGTIRFLKSPVLKTRLAARLRAIICVSNLIVAYGSSPVKGVRSILMPENRQRWASNTSSRRDRASPTQSNTEAGNRPWTPSTPADPDNANRTIGRGNSSNKRGGPQSQPTAGPDNQRAPRSGSSFEARFGRVILQHGIAAIPSALFHYQGNIGLKAQHVWFISYILSHKWDEDLPYPSLSNMARCSGVTLRNIQFIKSDLCRAGMLQIAERYTGKGGRDSNAYDFSGLFTHIEQLLSEEPDAPNKIRTDPPAPVPVPNTADPDDPDPSFVARFGRVIARRGVAAIPRAIFTHQKALGLTPQQVWFISYIFSFQWSTALPYPSINKMVQHTGYSRAHLHTIKAELVSAGYLCLVHRSNDQGGQDSNGYDFSGLLDAIRAQLQPDELLTQDTSEDQEPDSQRGKHLFSPRRGQVAARHRADARTAGIEDSSSNRPYESQQTGVYEIEQTGGYESQQIETYESQQTPPNEEGHTPPVRHDSYRDTNRGGRGTMKPSSHESESIQKEANDNKDDSNQLSPGRNTIRNGISSTSPSSISIVGVMDDFSSELYDPAHKASNITQAVHLWQASGVGEQEFIQLVYKAKQLTRKYQGKNGLRGIENKMAYFFAVLRDLCGLPSDTSDTSDTIDTTYTSDTADTDVQTIARDPVQEEQRAQQTGSASPGRGGVSLVNAKQLWQAALTELQITVPAASFQTWLKNTSIAAFENDRVVILVPSNFAKEWLEKRYSRQIAETLTNVLGYKVQMCFEVKTPGATR